MRRALAGILLVILTRCTPAAADETCALPWCVPPGAMYANTTGQPLFLFTRSMVDASIVSEERRLELETDLRLCNERVVRQTAPQGRSALWWAVAGAAVGVAFGAGVALGASL